MNYWQLRQSQVMRNDSIIHRCILSTSFPTRYFLVTKYKFSKLMARIIMIYRGQECIHVQMQVRTGAQFVMVNNPHVGQFEIENMEILLARTKTSLPTKPRDIKKEFRGWTAFTRFIARETGPLSYNICSQLSLYKRAQNI